MNVRKMIALGMLGVSPTRAITNAFLAISGCTGLWTMDNNSPLLDRSGNGHSLTQNGTPTFAKTSRGGDYAVEAASDYWNVADAAWNSITGAFCIAGWVKFSGVASAVEHIMAKYTSSGDQRVFDFQRSASGTLVMAIYSDGTLENNKNKGTIGTIGTDWNFVMGRYIPSTSLTVSINTVGLSNTTGIYASIKDGSGALELGSWNGGIAGMAGNQGAIALYNVAPTDAQIATLYNATKKFYINP